MAMSVDLAVVRQSVDQLAAQVAAGPEQMTRHITKLQAAEQDVPHVIPSASAAAGPGPDAQGRATDAASVASAAGTLTADQVGGPSIGVSCAPW